MTQRPGGRLVLWLRYTSLLPVVTRMETRGEETVAVSPFTLVRDSSLNVFFVALGQMGEMHKGKQLLVALATYWWDITHTFHFKWGEATITPADYGAITGLGFKGSSIVWRDDYTNDELKDLLGFEAFPRKGFGMQYADVKRELVKMIQMYEAGFPQIRPEHIARTFMWFALCSTLFGHAEGTCRFALLGSWRMSRLLMGMPGGRQVWPRRTLPWITILGLGRRLFTASSLPWR